VIFQFAATETKSFQKFKDPDPGTNNFKNLDGSSLSAGGKLFTKILSVVSALKLLTDRHTPDIT